MTVGSSGIISGLINVVSQLLGYTCQIVLKPLSSSKVEYFSVCNQGNHCVVKTTNCDEFFNHTMGDLVTHAQAIFTLRKGQMI